MSGFSSKTYSTVQLGGPLSSFNELNIAELTPVGQVEFAYGINTRIVNTLAFAGGSVAASSSLAHVNSGTSTSGSGDVALRRNLKYHAGQGTLSRATAIFDTPVASSSQLVGPGNAESGYYFGYSGTSFGVFHVQDGQREIRKLTVGTGAGTGLVTVTLDGASVNVPVTGGSNVNRTAYELSKYDYSQVGGGWLADAIDGTVFFLSSRPSPYTGSYSVAGSSIVGSFTVVASGAANTVSFVSQSSWNIDKLDGTGQSRMTLDPQKGNVYQVGFQYLGFGNAFFGVEDPNTGRIAPVHMIKNTNTRTTPVLKNPQVTTRVVSANIGNSTNVVVKTASMASFIEGKVVKLDPKFAFGFSYSAVDTSSTYKPLGIIKVNRVFNSKSCFGEIDLLRVGASNSSTQKNLTIALYKGSTVSGVANFVYINEANSVVSYASLNPATDTLNANGDVPFLTFQVGPNNATSIDIIEDNFVINAGDYVVVAIKTDGQVTGEFTLNWFEQQ